MPVRVLWLIKGLGPGGAEVLLAAAAESGFDSEMQIECAYVLPHKDHLVERLERAGVRCHCLGDDGAGWRWPQRLRRLLAEGDYDVVHAHSPLPAAVGRLVSTTLRNSPALVSTEHNAWGTFARSTRWANRATAGLDDACFAVSEETRASMSGRQRSRCTTLVHGIDLTSSPTLRADRAEVRRELGIAESTFVVGTVANYRTQKDYPNLLRAAAAWSRDGADVCVVAVGQGPLEREVHELRRQLRIVDAVRLLGYRPDAERVMASCDVFTLASSWEGLPVALMEALALALPIAATDVGGVGEALGPDDAVLVPPGDSRALADAWERIRTDDDLRSRLARRSAERSLDFDVRRATAVYASTYRALAQTNAPAESQRSTATLRAETASSPLRHRRPSGVEIRPADVGDRARILELLTRTLGWGDDPRFGRLFSWKHDDNPFGASPMWVAADGERIVGLRAFMRWDFHRGGETLRAVRAVDTATDPDYQGRGLFTALTMAGLEGLRQDGVDFVFNTPNEQSLPGYLKMGWEEVGRLPAAFRSRSPTSAARTIRARVPADLWSSPLQLGVPADLWLADSASTFSRRSSGDSELRSATTPEFLRWRYGNRLLGYRAIDAEDHVLIVRERRRGIARELVVADASIADDDTADCAAAAALRSSHCDHALRAGPPNLRRGFLPLPTGPRLTFRPLHLASAPPLADWALSLGDVELF